MPIGLHPRVAEKRRSARRSFVSTNHSQILLALRSVFWRFPVHFRAILDFIFANAFVSVLPTNQSCCASWVNNCQPNSFLESFWPRLAKTAGAALKKPILAAIHIVSTAPHWLALECTNNPAKRALSYWKLESGKSNRVLASRKRLLFIHSAMAKTIQHPLLAFSNPDNYSSLALLISLKISTILRDNCCVLQFKTHVPFKIPKAWNPKLAASQDNGKNDFFSNAFVIPCYVDNAAEKPIPQNCRLKSEWPNWSLGHAKIID